MKKRFIAGIAAAIFIVFSFFMLPKLKKILHNRAAGKNLANARKYR